MKNIDVKIKKLSEKAVIPKYSHETDSGFDFICTSKKETDQYIQYGTDLSFELPEGWYMEIFPRSSISKYDLSLCNSVGIIDNGYSGEIIFRFKRTNWFSMLTNLMKRTINILSTDNYTSTKINNLKNLLKDFIDNDCGIIYNEGDKIGQGILKQRPKVNFIEVNELNETERGSGAYGSTGK